MKQQVVGRASRHASSSGMRKASKSNHAKYLSYKYAMTRMEEAIKKRFYLEAVMIAESVISDRLLSATAHGKASSAASAQKHLGLSVLIDRGKSIGLPPALAIELHAWRVARNQVAHAVAKSAPNEPTMSVDLFCEQAESAAKQGQRLVNVMKRWCESAKRRGRETAIFTFTLSRTLVLDSEQARQFARAVGLKSVSQLKSLAKSVRSGDRRKVNEKSYLALDRRFLPRMRLEVFFENFNSPEAIFGAKSRLTKVSPLEGRILYFGVWDGDDDGAVSVEITLEAACALPILAHIDIENPDHITDTQVEEQLRECRNMFNFSFRGFEYDDDEALDHEWSARWSSSAVPEAD